MSLGRAWDTPMQPFPSQCLSSRSLPSVETVPGLLFTYTSEPNTWSFSLHNWNQLSGHQGVEDPQFNSSLTQTTNFHINLKGEGAQCHQDCPHCKKSYIPRTPSQLYSFARIAHRIQKTPFVHTYCFIINDMTSKERNGKDAWSQGWWLRITLPFCAPSVQPTHTAL